MAKYNVKTQPVKRKIKVGDLVQWANTTEILIVYNEGLMSLRDPSTIWHKTPQSIQNDQDRGLLNLCASGTEVTLEQE